MVLDPQDIINSVTVPELIKDDIVRNGKFFELKNGDLQCYVGGFSIVFPVEVQGKKWAFRCWHNISNETIERNKKLSIELKNTNLPFLIGYDFVQLGIIVKGQKYPTTRMQWIEGDNLKDYIVNNCNSKSKLLRIADHFLKMIKEMHRHSFAHGDLQHGNIIVNKQDELFLVDYDSFYCPKFAGEKDYITGLKEYQHPSRQTNKLTSEKIDYFSELIIYTSILGVAYNPTLVDKYQVKDSENLLFKSDDYKDIKHSSIYKDLKDLNAVFPILLGILENYLTKKTIGELEPFDVLMERMTKAPEIKMFYCSPSSNLYVGDIVNLNWLIEGANNVFLNAKPMNSSYCKRTLSIGRNTFTLKASNEFKVAQETLNVETFAIPEISLTATPKILHKDSLEKTVISWDVKNTTKVTLCYNGITEDVRNKGEKELTPVETTTYKLNIVGLDKTRLFEKDVTVGVYPKSTVTFTSDTNIVLSEKPVLLSWSVQNADKVELMGFGEVLQQGSKTVNPDRDTVYKLIVTDPFGIQEYNIPIKTLPVPVITFNSSKLKLNRDKAEKTNIYWNVRNVKKVALKYLGTEYPVTENGNKEVKFDETSEVVLETLALDGKTVYKKSFEIKVFNEAKISFASNRKYTIPEVPIELFWNVENSTSVELKGYGEVLPQSRKELSIKEETLFTLVVTDEFTTQERSILVKMLPLPTIRTISVPTPEFNSTLNVTINVPRINVEVKFPQINLHNVDLKMPSTLDMDNVFESISTKIRPNFLSEIKSLISHYFNKVCHN